MLKKSAVNPPEELSAIHSTGSPQGIGRTGETTPRVTVPWKISPTGVRLLKVAHLVLIVLFFGGILSSTAIGMSLNLRNFDEVYFAYKNLMVISDNIVRIGSVGILALGAVYGLFTNWRFFKFRWLTAKWALFAAQTAIGILLVDRLMTANMSLLDTEGMMAINNPSFLFNHFLRQGIVFVQISLALLIMAISVMKPWRNRTRISPNLSG